LADQSHASHVLKHRVWQERIKIDRLAHGDRFTKTKAENLKGLIAVLSKGILYAFVTQQKANSHIYVKENLKTLDNFIVQTPY